MIYKATICIIILLSLYVYLLIYAKRRAAQNRNFFLIGVAYLAAIWSIFSHSVWSFFSISGGLGGFFALFVVSEIVLLLHAFGYRASLKRASLAMGLMAASTVFQVYAFFSAAVAHCLDLAFGESLMLLISWPKFVFELVRASNGAAELWCYGLALILAFILGWSRAIDCLEKFENSLTKTRIKTKVQIKIN